MRTPRRRQHNKGMAIIETLPLMIIFVILTSYAFGFFGVIHTAILQSIAARTYAFETIRNRSNVTFFRHQKNNPNSVRSYLPIGHRLHSVVSGNSEDFIVTQRKISFGDAAQPEQSPRSNSSSGNSKKIQSLEAGRRNNKVGANPVWIMISYGLCINAKCGQ